MCDVWVNERIKILFLVVKLQSEYETLLVDLGYKGQFVKKNIYLFT